MSKTIRVDDQVYNELEELRGKRETFSQVIERLLAIVRPLRQASEILGPSHYLKERPKEEASHEVSHSH